ncbi:uncharacterized protein TNCV_3845421 [Trichonephila clavipes]|nr:uncharacterized protein TNCV_3845421 [Trichonephila clavipes]
MVKDWFEALGYRVVEHKATDYAHLKQAMTEQFPVVRNRSELETRFYSSSQKDNQKPSDFLYDLLKIHKQLKLEMMEGKLLDHVISRLEPQILDYVEVRHPQTTSNLLQIIDKYEEMFLNRSIRYSDNSRPQRVFNRFEGQGVADNRRFDGRHRGGQSDHRFHNKGRRQGGSRNDAFRDQPGLTHVLYHEIYTGDQGLVVSRPYRYDKFKQGIIDYHIEKMLQEGKIRPMQSPYASLVLLTRKNNGLPPDFPEAYRFAIDYRKLNAITKYPRYPLPSERYRENRIYNTQWHFCIPQDAIRPFRGGAKVSKGHRHYTETVYWVFRDGIYVDDVIITSPSFNQHIDHLNQKHRSGVQNVAADVLSTNPVGNMDGSQISCAALRALALNSIEELIREQREDRELGHIYRYLENPNDGSVNATVCEG